MSAPPHWVLPLAPRVVVTVSQRQVECLAANCYEVSWGVGRDRDLGINPQGAGSWWPGQAGDEHNCLEESGGATEGTTKDGQLGRDVAKHIPLLFSQSLIGPRSKRNVEEPFQVDVDLVLCSIPTIERVGGGGIRWCSQDQSHEWVSSGVWLPRSSILRKQPRLEMKIFCSYEWEDLTRYHL